MSETEKDLRHKQRMEKKKAVIDARIQKSDTERGVVVVNTGNGKGKSSSGFGVMARALGHGLRVGVVQFIKGRGTTGEEAFFRRFPEVEYHVMGEGFTWETQDRERDIATARLAWEKALAMLKDESYDLVLLDELNIVLKYRYLPVEEVIDALRQRPARQHVVITGRGAPQALIDAADTVTRMDELKHAYQAGVKAQKGLEY
jgi:cob(I)alamin adenosyltransferase